jgi:hypothetical protein
MAKVFSSSYFALPPQRHGFSDALTFYNEKKYFNLTLFFFSNACFSLVRYAEFLALVFPILEQALRRLYVCVNPSLDSAIILASGIVTTSDFLFPSPSQF